MTLFKKAYIPTYTINWLTALLNPVIYILCNPTFRYDTQVLVLKITKKYTQNMILMSRWDSYMVEKGPKNSGKPPPPFRARPETELCASFINIPFQKSCQKKAGLLSSRI